MMSTRLTCIVDDSADYRFILQHLFSQSFPHYPALFFSGGQALLSELPRMNQKPDLIILDRHMPNLDGHQTLLHLRKQPAHQITTVVMMSADATPEEIKSCYEAGANSFLHKKLAIDSLKQTISLVCKYWLELNQTYSGRFD